HRADDREFLQCADHARLVAEGAVEHFYLDVVRDRRPVGHLHRHVLIVVEHGAAVGHGSPRGGLAGRSFRSAQALRSPALRMRYTRTPELSWLDSKTSPVSRNRLGMSMAVKGSVHSSTSASPGTSLASTLRALSAGRGQRNPRRSSVCSAMHAHEHAAAYASRARA